MTAGSKDPAVASQIVSKALLFDNVRFFRTFD